MVFWKRKETSRPSVLEEVPWNQETVERFVDRSHFDVLITNITKTAIIGQTAEGKPNRDPLRYEAWGLISWPKTIFVDIQFDIDSSEGPFGSYGYNVYDRHTVHGQPVKLPVISIGLGNGSLEAAQAIFEAHRTALLQGLSHSCVRFWKTKGDGRMSEADKERGWSDGGYSLHGVITWNELQSRCLPLWAIPHYYSGFALEQLPRYWDAPQLTNRDRLAVRLADALSQR